MIVLHSRVTSCMYYHVPEMCYINSKISHSNSSFGGWWCHFPGCICLKVIIVIYMSITELFITNQGLVLKKGIPQKLAWRFYWYSTFALCSEEILHTSYICLICLPICYSTIDLMRRCIFDCHNFYVDTKNNTK